MGKIKTFRPKQVKDNQQDNKTQSQRVVQSGQTQPNKPLNSQNTVKFIPLGGVGDVTKNMYIYEYGDDIVIVDCGVGFPSEGMPGVDLVIPNINYLKDKKHKIRGILITHAHDDHIGGLPYIWPELDVPIYAQKLTAGLIKVKFTEHKLPKDKIITVGINDTVKLGSFKASFYAVSHSIPDSTGIVLDSPVGTLIHQADFKLDWTPVNGRTTDLGRLSRIAERGITFMTIDCLRIEKPGYTLSEKTIEPTFAMVERETPYGKVLITMTSSNITRIQQAINVAVKSGRKISLSGRSMESNFQVARDLGYLDVPAGLVIPQEEIKRFPDNRLLIIIAGSQGQPDSALARAAHNGHKYIRLTAKDSVVFSADPIPGLEAAQGALIDTLTNIGCKVYYSALTSDLHVSGHAASEELKQVIGIAHPKFLFPIGGTFRHMKAFSETMQDMGYEEKNVIISKDGEIVAISRNAAKIDGKVEVSNVYVDGLGVGDVGSIVLRDRQVMSEEGIVIVVVPVDHNDGSLAGEPDVISRGLMFGKESEDLMESAKELVKSCLVESSGSPIDWRYVRHEIEDSLEKFFFGELKRNPLILPIVTEI